MPKVEFYSGSATGTNIAVTKSAVATNLYTIDYILEGRIDPDNCNTASMSIPSPMVINLQSNANPIEGHKFFGDNSASVTDDIFSPLVAAFKTNIVPINLNASTSFILTKEQREPEEKKNLWDEAVDFVSEYERELLLGLTAVNPVFGTSVAGVTGLAKSIGSLFKKKKKKTKAQKQRERAVKLTKMYALARDNIKIRRIIIPKTPNIMPITNSIITSQWGLDMSDYLDTFGHWTYVFNCDISVDGKFAANVDNDKRPTIVYLEPIVEPEYIEFVVALQCPTISSDDRMVVELDFNILCELVP